MVSTSNQLTSFFAAIDTALQAVWTGRESQEELHFLVLEGQTLCRQLIAIGEESDERLKLIPKEALNHQASDLVLQFHWMEAAKSFMILWRNTVFEHLKAQLLIADDKLNQAGWYQWQIEAQEQTEAAAKELQAFWEEHEILHSTDNTLLTKELTQLQQQDSPWPVYREQFTHLVNQLEELWSEFKTLMGNSDAIQALTTVVFDTIHECLREVQEHKSLAKEGIVFIAKNAAENKNKIPNFIEQLEEKILQTKHSKSFKPELEKQLKRLSGNSSVPVAATPSAIQTKDIDFRRYLGRWLESEILPLLYEVWELTINIRNNLKMAFINIRNRAILLNNDNIDQNELSSVRSEDLAQPLNSFGLQTQNRERELEEINQLIHQRLDRNFKLTTVFREDEFFLSVPLQSTINQFRTNQNQLLKQVLDWSITQRKRLQNWFLSVQEEDALSISEKVVRYIEGRKSNISNQAYTSIFLTKGYIGESFWVGRKSELKRIANLIEQWKLGYRGAVILTGNRFSGKSLIGDLISNNHFPNSTVRLLPNSSLKFNGRTFKTSYNLLDALNFVSKYTPTAGALIWLDDLELWHDTTHSLSENVESLKQHINRYSNRIFYQVSLSKSLLAKLDKSNNISKHFQSTIVLDNMSQEEIKNAILIRHGATHKELVNETGTPVSPTVFQQLISRTYRAANGNIGEALNLWACATKVINHDEVRQESSNIYALPNFIDADQAILLRSLLFEKRSNEYRLRKRLGPAFQFRYAPVLQRLLSVGILERHIDGWLEISEAAVNDIIEQLDQKGYLNS
ncbi:MAG: hypothetical protein AAGJ93_05165 [Bacteroidota bacterium]